MFDWLIELAKWLYQFWPARIVNSFQQGVRFYKGQDEALLRTGLHWFWPIVGSLDVECVVEDVCPLETQTLTTIDDKSITLIGSVAYKITNMRKWLTGVTDFHTSLQGKCERYLARAIRSKKYLDIVATQDELEESLRKEITAAVEDWGVKILDVGITSFSQTPSLRIYGKLPTSV